MSNKEKKTRQKRRSDSDGVTVKRSYYSFSKYYPGGGSSQKYRRVMKETKDEKLPLKIALCAIGLIIVIFIGYFTTTVGLVISNAPTTEPTVPVTESVTTEVPVTSTQETTQKAPVTTEKPTESTTIEEPEREVNVTSFTEESEGEITEPETEEITEVFTGY